MSFIAKKCDNGCLRQDKSDSFRVKKRNAPFCLLEIAFLDSPELVFLYLQDLVDFANICKGLL